MSEYREDTDSEDDLMMTSLAEVLPTIVKVETTKVGPRLELVKAVKSIEGGNDPFFGKKEEASEEKYVEQSKTKVKEGKCEMRSLDEQLAELRRENCRLLQEREEMMKSQGDIGDREEEKKLERARVARDQLRLHYVEKEAKGEVKVTREQFEERKEMYFKTVLEEGELMEELHELEAELTSTNNAVARLDREIWRFKPEEQQQVGAGGNPWQVGVPYGSGPARYRR